MKTYTQAIEDCKDVLGRIYQKYHVGDIYNKEIANALDDLKKFDDNKVQPVTHTFESKEEYKEFVAWLSYRKMGFPAIKQEPRSIKDYKNAFIELYNKMEEEHGDISSVMVATDTVPSTQCAVGTNPKRTTCTIILK